MQQPEYLTRVELVAAHARAKAILMWLCEYPEQDADKEAETLVGYWFENLYPRVEMDEPTPTGKLRELNNCARHSAMSLIGGRFYPHHDVKVYVDEAGTFWADQHLFC